MAATLVQAELTLPVDYVVDAVRKSTHQVFSTMLEMDPQDGEHRCVAELAPSDGVIALLGFNGPWVGMGAIQLADELACNLAGSRRIKAGATRDHFLGVSAVSGRGELF